MSAWLPENAVSIIATLCVLYVIAVAGTHFRAESIDEATNNFLEIDSEIVNVVEMPSYTILCLVSF